MFYSNLADGSAFAFIIGLDFPLELSLYLERLMLFISLEFLLRLNAILNGKNFIDIFPRKIWENVQKKINALKEEFFLSLPVPLFFL